MSQTLQQCFAANFSLQRLLQFYYTPAQAEEYRSENRPPLIIGVAQSSPWEKEENGHLLFLS